MHRLLPCLLLVGCGAVEDPPAPAPAPSAEPAPAPAAASAPTAAPAKAAAPEAGQADACPWQVRDGTLVHSFVAGRDLEPQLTEVDLDGEPPADAVAFLGGCGAYGECEHVALLGCEQGGYRAVWGPDYAMGLGVGEHPEGARYANLRVGGRLTRGTCDLPVQHVLRWSEGSWTRGEPCAAGKGIWEPACGERPPPCD